MKNEQSVKRMSRLKCFSVANFFVKYNVLIFTTHPPPPLFSNSQPHISSFHFHNVCASLKQEEEKKDEEKKFEYSHAGCRN